MTVHEPTLEERLSSGRLPNIDEGERVIWDDRVTGMGIEEAREVARSLVDLGALQLRVAPTLASFVPAFIEDNAGRWKPNTVKSHRRGLMRHTVPVLGAKPVDAIIRVDVVAWQDGLDMAAGSREEVMSITDQSERMVKHYAGRRHKRALAKSAILKLEQQSKNKSV